MRFYLGTHEVSWLSRSDVPLFISAVRLRRQKKLHRARVPPVLDSSGFSMLSLHGLWTVSDEQYADDALRWSDPDRGVGPFEWAAPRDWMCEPSILAKTGLDVAEHQRRTIASFVALRELAPSVRWAPVLQGWKVDDYLSHIEQYRAAGVELAAAPVVGVGSVCRRQGTHEGAAIMRAVSREGLAVHAFGIKTQGMALFGDRIASADSMAWSYVARRRHIRLPGCTHKTCANCYRFAMQWHGELLDKIGERMNPLRQTEMPW